jgi:HD-GYP domain-containing protein (c-di-GMP phosphodiesterase class II)
MMLVDEVDHVCASDSNAAFAALFVVKKGSYPIRHSIDTAILTCLMARKRGLGEQNRLSAVAAALTMNIAMIDLQETLHEQALPLTIKQKKLIFNHPIDGLKMLEFANVTDELWLKCVLTHHEKFDQTGYPNRIDKDELSEEVQLITAADQYCAKISSRAYRQPVLHQETLKNIFMRGGQIVAPEIAASFIKALGFYPPGMLVQLSNDEIGVVIECGKKAGSPVVLACSKLGEYNYHLPVQRDTSLVDYKISQILLSTDPKITFDRRKLWPFEKK